MRSKKIQYLSPSQISAMTDTELKANIEVFAKRMNARLNRLVKEGYHTRSAGYSSLLEKARVQQYDIDNLKHAIKSTTDKSKKAYYKSSLKTLESSQILKLNKDGTVRFNRSYANRTQSSLRQELNWLNTALNERTTFTKREIEQQQTAQYKGFAKYMKEKYNVTFTREEYERAFNLLKVSQDSSQYGYEVTFDWVKSLKDTDFKNIEYEKIRDIILTSSKPQREKLIELDIIKTAKKLAPDMDIDVLLDHLERGTIYALIDELKKGL